jgi:hypothetical protein
MVRLPSDPQNQATLIASSVATLSYTRVQAYYYYYHHHRYYY